MALLFVFIDGATVCVYRWRYCLCFSAFKLPRRADSVHAAGIPRHRVGMETTQNVLRQGAANNKVTMTYSNRSHTPQCFGWKSTNSVFPLPDTDSDTYGYNSNMQNCFHWTYTETYSYSNGYCTHFCHQYQYTHRSQNRSRAVTTTLGLVYIKYPDQRLRWR